MMYVLYDIWLRAAAFKSSGKKSETPFDSGPTSDNVGASSAHEKLCELC